MRADRTAKASAAPADGATMPSSDATPLPLPSLLDAIAAEHDAVLRLHERVAAVRALVGDGRGLLPLAADDVETALDRLEDATRRRERHLASVATTWGLAPDLRTLARLAERAPQPWATILADHQRVLPAAVADVEADMLDGLLELADGVAAAHAAAGDLRLVGGPTPTGDATHATALDRTDREMALIALSRPLPLSLTAFLR